MSLVADCGLHRTSRACAGAQSGGGDGLKLAARFTFVPGLFIGGSITYQRGEPEK